MRKEPREPTSPQFRRDPSRQRIPIISPPPTPADAEGDLLSNTSDIRPADAVALLQVFRKAMSHFGRIQKLEQELDELRDNVAVHPTYAAGERRRLSYTAMVLLFVSSSLSTLAVGAYLGYGFAETRAPRMNQVETAIAVGTAVSRMVKPSCRADDK